MSDRLCPLKEAAQDTPNAIALVANGIRYTFSELDCEADRTAHLLSKSFKKGDKLSVQASPDLSFLSQLFAAIRLGLSFCPLNSRVPLVSDRIDKATPADFLLFTSGSTATPKLARLSLDNLLSSARGVIETVDLKAGDGWHLSLPPYHVGGLGIIFRSILARSQIILDSNSNGITHLSYVPTQLYRAWPIYPKLKAILLGGAPIQETPRQLPIIATYGLTEMGSAVLAQRPVWKEGKLYLGFPLKGREMKLVDGEIFVRGACLFQGYDGESSPDWFATGDLATFDPKEGYAIVGRKDNQFISGGENIQPEEIEQHLLQHPAVLEAIVVPKIDPEFGMRPVAFVTTIDRFDTLEMSRFLSKRLPKYKIPISLFSLEKVAKIGLKPNRKKIFESLNSP